MKLAASVIVRNELGRYLETFLDHLYEFCDLVVLWDDGSTDATLETVAAPPRPALRLHSTRESGFFANEGQARQRLLEATLSWEPTHVLAIDADEFVADGPAVRKACERDVAAFALEMVEVWEADSNGLCVRVDGGWVPHPTTVVWRVPDRIDASWRITDRKLACGRVPQPVNQSRMPHLGVDLLHFGWARDAERVARHARYATHDGGRFHRSQHLDSIMYPCRQVQLEAMSWPAGLVSRRDAILATVERP